MTKIISKVDAHIFDNGTVRVKVLNSQDEQTASFCISFTELHVSKISDLLKYVMGNFLGGSK
jgi:hypothetical protein